MTKQHFIALADAIRDHNIKTENEGGFEIFAPATIETLADFCQAQNPRFNRECWLGYIAGTNGKNGGKVK